MCTFSQGDALKNFSFPSPAATNIEEFGDVPVNLAIGSPKVNLPFYQVSEGDLNVPLSLEYNSTGLKVDNHPGWVGSGWSLSAGGMITRIINGEEDELFVSKINNWLISNQLDQDYEVGYHYNHADLNVSNWSIDTEMSSNFPFSANLPLKDYEPDEFNFKVGDITGSFLMGEDGEWHVKGDPTIQVESFIKMDALCPGVIASTFGSPQVQFNSRWTTGYYAGFKLTMADGTIYYFGNYEPDLVGADEAIETSHDPMTYYKWHKRADAWHVVKIENPISQDEITFEYEKKDEIMSVLRHMAVEIEENSVSFSGFLHSYAEYHHTGDIISKFKGRMIQPCYLKNINTNNLTLEFHTSQTNELRYDFQKLRDAKAANNDDEMPTWSWIVVAEKAWQSGGSDIQWHQLDSIVIKNGFNNSRLRSFRFYYTDDDTKRLQLLSFLKPGNLKYEFNYNSTPLPDYLSTNTDHWGFHNGLAPLFGDQFNTQTIDPSNPPITIQELEDYWQLREPDANFMDAEILEKIIYPTGGYTQFEYEPLFYESFVHRSESDGSLAVYSNSSATNGHHTLGYAGGLRVKKITHNDLVGDPIETEYTYEGGILNGDYQYFWQDYEVTIGGVFYGGDRFMTNSWLPTSNGAGHVQYSKVTERQIGQGHTEHTFTNHLMYPDNNYVNTIDWNLSIYEPMEDISYKRGLPLKIEFFNEDDHILKKVEYAYGDVSLTGIPSTVKAVKNGWMPIWGGSLQLATAYRIHMHPFLLTEMSTKDYFIDNTGNWTHVAKVQELDYDLEFGLNNYSAMTNSDGTKYIKETVFSGNLNPEFHMTPEISALNKLKNLHHVLDAPIEETEYIQKSGSTKQMIASSYNQYRNSVNRPFLTQVWKTELNTPVSGFQPIHFNANFTELIKSSYYTHDGEDQATFGMTRNSDGRIIELAYADDLPIWVIWNNKYKLPIAKIRNGGPANTAYTDFDYEGSFSTGTGWNYSGLRTSNTGYSQSRAASFSWGDVIQKTNIDPGKYFLQYRQRYGTIDVSINGTIVESTSSGSNDHILKRHIIEITDYSDLISIEGSGGTIDNLGLFPFDGEYTVYEYDNESFDLLHESHSNWQNMGYSYDTVQRLIEIKNFEGDLKTVYDYNYTSGVGNFYTDIHSVLVSGLNSRSQLSSLNNDELVTKRTYVNGLGRTLQINSLSSSPNERDVITMFEYDQYGKQSKQYLPFTYATQNSGDYLSNASLIQGLFYGNPMNASAFSESIYEASPLFRVSQAGSPGDTWAIGSGNEISKVYRTNESSEVRWFNSQGVSTQYYAASKLLVEETHDENGNQLIKYSNLIGQTILLDNEGLQTYHVYDDLGRLKYVVPPKVIDKMKADNVYNVNLPVYKVGIFNYTHDSRGRVIRKTIPGKSKQEYFYYDNLDRLVLHKNANDVQKFTKYDILGRKIMLGVYNGNGTPSSSDGLYETRTISTLGYTTNQSFPTSNMIVHEMNYYDQYDLNNNGVLLPAEIYYPDATNEYPNVVDYNTHGNLVANSKVLLDENYQLGNPEYITKRFFYDKYNNNIQVKNLNHMGGSDIVYTDYDFNGWIQKSKRLNRVNFNNSLVAHFISKRYVYDHRGRMLDIYQSVNGNPETHLVRNAYNERDLISSKKLGLNTNGDSWLQNVNYRYNIRNWLTDINNVHSGDINTPLPNDNESLRKH
jgi:hypothetical protein